MGGTQDRRSRLLTAVRRIWGLSGPPDAQLYCNGSPITAVLFPRRPAAGLCRRLGTWVLGYSSIVSDLQRAAVSAGRADAPRDLPEGCTLLSSRSEKTV